jgi:hypothetical protein
MIRDVGMIIPSHKNHEMTRKLLYMSYKKIHPKQLTYSYKKTLTMLIDLEMERGEQKIIIHLLQEKKGYSSNASEHFFLCLQPTIEWFFFEAIQANEEQRFQVSTPKF